MGTFSRSLLLLPLLQGLVNAIPVNEPALVEKRTLPAGYYNPPYYPTPKGGWASEWDDAYAKAAAVVSEMTLAEKVNLTTGTGLYMGPCVGNTGSALRFGIPNLCLQDGPLGIRWVIIGCPSTRYLMKSELPITTLPFPPASLPARPSTKT